MDSNTILKLLIGIVGVGFLTIVIVYFNLKKKASRKRTKYLVDLVQGTKAKTFSMEIFYQKVYLVCMQIPGIKRYTEKLRKRIEIINLGDEYLTRTQTAKIMAKALPIIFITSILIIKMTKGNMLLMSTLLLLLVFFLETLISGSVDKAENQLLKEQLEFFAEMRHAYHEYNMVEEAIYEVSQNDELPEVSRQGERIHEILLSDDPETELEKYYDIAPNDFLKEFAGISYLTREFGDRKDENGASLYLKNLNNITQEMQIEILKRDKLDYMFQSLSVIALVPVLFIEPLKGWAVKTFGFTKQFYEGRIGFLMQVFLVLLTTISYVLVRKLKDNGRLTNAQMTSDPWQNKLYKKKPIKKFVDLFIPKPKTKEYRVKIKMLKDSASNLKLEWLYVTKITYFILAFIVSILLFLWAHRTALDYVYNEPTADYNLLGTMGNVDKKAAIKKTQEHNKLINEAFRRHPEPSKDDVEKIMKRKKEYKSLDDQSFEKELKTVNKKVETVKREKFSWFELLIAFAFSFLAYYIPEILMKFQYKMRQLEMENEVMQYHTIILMLMKIERVNVEMILEWLERYSNIFREPISKCVNNFEAGGYEALEELKEDVTYSQFIRIVESLQAAVDQIPIREAFDELDTERSFYQDKRKESNERLIERKSRMGKMIGFTPMVVLFVGYLIIPMMGIGVTSMGEALEEMSKSATKNGGLS